MARKDIQGAQQVLQSEMAPKERNRSRDERSSEAEFYTYFDMLNRRSSSLPKGQYKPVEPGSRVGSISPAQNQLRVQDYYTTYSAMQLYKAQRLSSVRASHVLPDTTEVKYGTILSMLMEFQCEALEFETSDVPIEKATIYRRKLSNLKRAKVKKLAVYSCQIEITPSKYRVTSQTFTAGQMPSGWSPQGSSSLVVSPQDIFYISPQNLLAMSQQGRHAAHSQNQNLIPQQNIPESLSPNSFSNSQVTQSAISFQQKTSIPSEAQPTNSQYNQLTTSNQRITDATSPTQHTTSLQNYQASKVNSKKKLSKEEQNVVFSKPLSLETLKKIAQNKSEARMSSQTVNIVTADSVKSIHLDKACIKVSKEDAASAVIQTGSGKLYTPGKRHRLSSKKETEQSTVKNTQNSAKEEIACSSKQEKQNAGTMTSLHDFRQAAEVNKVGGFFRQ